MKKILVLGLLVVIAAFMVESTSSYFLYRYYSSINENFVPSGSSTWVLLARLYTRLGGEREVPKLKVDHGPLFGSDPVLGYVMYPGEYNIAETFKRSLHVFHLSVNALGRRATAYEPVSAPHRIYVTGDSALFGWGLNDQETLGWLLQQRLPGYEVINMSLNSYSTVHALLQLQAEAPRIGPDDVIILTYHKPTNSFNVASPDMLKTLLKGDELQLGDPGEMAHVAVPFGSLDAENRFSIHRIKLSCVAQDQGRECIHPAVSEEMAMRVSMRAFDEILAMHVGRLVVAFIGGPDDDPVIRHARAQGIVVADLRTAAGDADEDDLILTDKHTGAFWHYNLFVRLLTLLQHNRLIH